MSRNATPSQLGILLLVCSLLALSPLQAETGRDASIRQQLKRQLNINPHLLLELDRPVVLSFYREHDFQPLWVSADGRLPRAEDLAIALSRADEHGLEPAEYFIPQINRHFSASGTDELIELELWLTAALYRYSNDMHSGRLDPYAIDADWHIPNSRLDIDELMREVASQDSITDLLAELAPDQLAYRRMQQSLARYREIARQGGWPRVQTWPRLEHGKRDDGVASLRLRLLASGDLASAATEDAGLFDDRLKWALARFQRRHGMIADGILDSNTLHALNVRVEDRIAQLRLNMERWRWLPNNLGSRYVAVNMTGFELAVVEDESTVLSMPVIIGKPFRETPALSGLISSLVYNPYWTITKNVMWEKFIPGQIGDPDYLGKRSVRVFRGWADAEEVDPKSVDWTALDRTNNSPYWMRQDPGPGNALGEIKFLFSNPYYIYLHGSPQKHLFERNVRTYSHGCIRVKDPAALAEYLQGGPSPEVREAVASKVDSGHNEKVILPQAVPLYLMYWTAWVDEAGVLNFRDDIYGRDAKLRQRLTLTGLGDDGAASGS